MENCESQDKSLKKQAFEALKESSDFIFAPCEKQMDFSDKTRFAKLECGPEQKMYLSGLVQQMPTLVASGSLAQAYTVKFPQGLPHTLSTLRQGRFGSMIHGADGKFVGTASFYPMQAQAVLLGAFSAMAIASGQYFLTEIRSELNMMNLKLDKILEFLYGDKKAELMAEISFARYAYQNYSAIMACEAQRNATITSLQQSKKVAMKDIEFYMNDLHSAVNAEGKNYENLEALSENALQIKESLDLSIQLYVMSSLLEVYYAQNYAEEYINYLESEMLIYMDKCEKRILSSFSVLKRRLDEYKSKPLEKVDKSIYTAKIAELIAPLNSGEESTLRKSVRSALHASSRNLEYYLSEDGSLYCQAV